MGPIYWVREERGQSDGREDRWRGGTDRNMEWLNP